MRLKLVKKIDEAKGTKSFFFEPEKEVNWLPGQYYYYTIPDLKHEDSRGPTRHFTISSSTTEGNLLRLTTRIREESGYKKTLDELKIGHELEGEGPSGTFILDENEVGKSHVFVAGGIGITPFRVFVKYNLDKSLNIPMYLIQSNGDPEYVFGQELKDLAKESSTFKAEFVDTSKSGRLDDSKIQNMVDGWSLKAKDCVFWLVGPPPFVSAMENALDKLKVPSDNQRTEKFTGY